MKSFCHTPRHTESVTKVHLANLGPCYTRFASLLNVQSRAEAGENEQPFATRQLREPKGIPNDDQTGHKSPIGDDRVAKLALTRRESRQYVKCLISQFVRKVWLTGDWRGIFWQTLATERMESGEARLAKIEELIEAPKHSIHDLSRCQSTAEDEMYRLNMAFELGIDYGCRKYHGEASKEKRILILEEQQFRYQAAISDLAGRDIKYHDGEYVKVIRAVRKWIVSSGGFEEVPASRVVSEYEDFQEWLWEK